MTTRDLSVLLLLLSTLLFSCTPPPKNLNFPKLNGPIKSVTIEKFAKGYSDSIANRSYDLRIPSFNDITNRYKDPWIANEHHYHPDIQNAHYEFDKNGQITIYQKLDKDNQVVSTSTYQVMGDSMVVITDSISNHGVYHYKNDLLHKTLLKRGNKFYRKEYLYNKEQQIIREELYHYEGKNNIMARFYLHNKKTYKYNNGQLRESNYFRNSRNLKQANVFVYDDRKLLSECHVYDNRDRLFVAMYICNEYSDVLEYRLIDMKNKVLQHYNFKPVYDEYNNWTEVYVNAGNNLHFRIIRTIEYY